MEFFQVDVFASAPFAGNPLAVFPDAGSLTSQQMQVIAREMNLSETTFVTQVGRGRYDVRIFTPTDELPFAGHPTIGTCSVLRHLGLLEGDEMVQRSKAGDTALTMDGEDIWFERTGSAAPDLAEERDDAAEIVAHTVGLPEEDVGLALGEVALRPAFADAGIRQLMVPTTSLDALGRCVPDARALGSLGGIGTYCFTPAGGGWRARGFFPGIGVAEDPATGSAAAALGLYMAARVGRFEAEVLQGEEVGRPSRIVVAAEPGTVRVGGRCELMFRARLDVLP